MISLVNRDISVLSRTMSRRQESVSGNPDVSAVLAELHHKLVIILVDKSSNNIVLVCITHYSNCLKKGLGMSTTAEKSTYKLTTLSRE